MNVQQMKRGILFGVMSMSLMSFAGLTSTVEYISWDNIGQMANSDYTPENDYQFHFVNGAQDISDGSDYAAVRKAFGAWVDLPSSDLSVREVIGTSGFTPGEYNGNNEISWIGTGYGYDDPWTEMLGLSENAIAVVMTWYYPATGEVAERDMYFNDVYYDWRTDSDGQQDGGFSVEHIALHEIGHIFGLKDLYNPDQPGWESWMGDDNEALTMYGYSAWYADDITLSAEDVYAMSLLHPDSSFFVPEPSPAVMFMFAGGVLIAVRKP